MKGYYTQALFVFTGVPLPLEELNRYLPEFPYLRILPPPANRVYGGESALIAFRPAVNGYVVIDSVANPWPDHLGDPKGDVHLYSAWQLGHFGPFSYPGGLNRAIEHASFWHEAREHLHDHTSMIRLRMTYAIDAAPTAPLRPPDCDPLQELTFMTDIARCLLRHPAAVCYFNPNGETLFTFRILDEFVDHNFEHDTPTLQLWCNVRHFNLADNWLLVDSVGNWQFDMPDHEVAFPQGTFDPEEAANFIRMMSVQILKGATIRDGEKVEGAGGAFWRATVYTESLTAPPREVVCWMPETVEKIPPLLRKRTRKPRPDEDPKTKRAWWRMP